MVAVLQAAQGPGRRDAFLFIGAPDVVDKTIALASKNGSAVVDTALNLDEAHARLAQRPYDAVFLEADVAAPDPVERVRELRACRPEAVVAILMGQPQCDQAIVMSTVESIAIARENRRLTQQLFRREKQASLGRLVSGLCHEFNNPLAFILSNTENLLEYVHDVNKLIALYKEALIKHKLFDAKFAELEQSMDFEFVMGDSERAIKDAVGGAKRLRELVSAMRVFGSGDGGERVPTDLGRVAQQAAAILAKPLRERATLQLDAEPGIIALANPGAVTQVIVMLMTNSLDAFGDRPTSANHVRLAIEARGDRYAVIVEDNGPGVPGEIREKIFDPFFTTKPPGKGDAGLGLAVAMSIAEDHGGELVLEPSPHGARFALVVPAGLM